MIVDYYAWQNAKGKNHLANDQLKFVMNKTKEFCIAHIQKYQRFTKYRMLSYQNIENNHYFCSTE